MMSAPKNSLLKPKFLVVAYLNSSIDAFILGIRIGNDDWYRMLLDTKDYLFDMFESWNKGSTQAKKN